METFDAPASVRQQTEERLRRELAQALKRYRAAASLHRRELARQRGEPARGLTSRAALIQARHAESEALAEYARLLRLFTDLTMYGKMPGDPPLARAVRVPDGSGGFSDSGC